MHAELGLISIFIFLRCSTRNRRIKITSPKSSPPKKTVNPQNFPELGKRGRQRLRVGLWIRHKIVALRGHNKVRRGSSRVVMSFVWSRRPLRSAPKCARVPRLLLQLPTTRATDSWPTFICLDWRRERRDISGYIKWHATPQS